MSFAPHRTALTVSSSALVYVDGDASIGTYQDANGQTRSSLNVVQRMYQHYCSSRL